MTQVVKPADFTSLLMEVTGFAMKQQITADDPRYMRLMELSEGSDTLRSLIEEVVDPLLVTQ